MQSNFMNVNINHPSFISFIDMVNKSIISNLKINNYFILTKNKKTAIQYLVLKLIIKSVKIRGTLTNTELLDFTKILQKRNETQEIYELAGILNDIITNFDTLIEMGKTGGLKPKKSLKNGNKNIKI